MPWSGKDGVGQEWSSVVVEVQYTLNPVNDERNLGDREPSNVMRWVAV